LKIPRARVTSAQTVGSNWKIYVTDESGGTIAVFIPASTVSDLGIELPKEGAIVVVAGYRDVYRGEQEIVVVSKNGFVVQG
jgi:DNA/RNA endonuclease YhcR with UshA esterase domain